MLRVGIATLALGLGGVALTAVAPASATTVGTGITVRAAVQGDRMLGPFVMRSAAWSDHDGSLIHWDNWLSGATQANRPSRLWLYTPFSLKTPPEFWEEAVEPWTFPAVGTTGPIMNQYGKCLTIGPSHVSSDWPDARLVIYGDCEGASDATVSVDGIIMLDELYVADLGEGSDMPKAMVAVSDVARAEHLYMAGLAPVAAADCVDGLTGSVSNITHPDRSADLSGTGAAGETITVTTPNGPEITVVDSNGGWNLTVTGLPDGDSTLTVNSSDNCALVELSVLIDVLEVPIMPPAVAAGAVVLGLGALGFGGLLRRRNTAHI